MAGTGGKNKWALFLLILSGIVLGGFIGYLTQDISFLSWLNYGQEFGLNKPVVLNLGIMTITFGLQMKISIASILGVVLSILIFKKI